MKSQLTVSLRTKSYSFTRVLAFIALVALIAVPLFSTSSASSIRKILGKTASSTTSGLFSSRLSNSPLINSNLAPVADSIATFAADCTTPKTDFYLGDTVCAKTDGVTATDRFVNWLTPDVQVFASGPTITTNPETTTITLPTSASYVGTWKASIADPSDSSIVPAPFTVSEVPIIATYDAACAIPKTNFVLGEMVCVKVNGVPVNPTFPNKISWVDTVGFIEQRTDLITDPQSDTFQLPASDTSTVNGVLIDNRGIWRVHVTRNNGRLQHTALFNVSDAANPAAHLVVRKFVSGTETAVDAGSNVSFVITLANRGPDAAAAVNLVDPTPANLTFVSFTQTSGPALTCNDADCTIASLAPGESAEFLATYTLNLGTAGGTVVTNTAVVSSETGDPDDTERTASAEITASNAGNQATCVLECPGNIIVTANTTQGGDEGALVTFASADPSGDCGAITATPASGSFFAVGSHTVSVTSATGGGSCSFTVTVVEDNPPTITCPLPDITADAGAGNTETNVSVTAPAATGTNVSVSGRRSDAQLLGEPPSLSPDLTDPYPVGTTIITWTATEFIDGQPGRSASCTQKVIVTAPDAPTITCPVDKSFNQEGCGAKTLTAGDIGSPTTSGNGITVEATRSDSLHVTDDPYPIGVTVITWTATDNIGRVVSCTQRITIVASGDTEPPTITAPPNVSVSTNSCGMIVGETQLGTPEASDNCGTANINRTGVPLGNFFPTGTTTITYTATDGAGNTATATQTVTVTEDPAINPTISAPGDLSFNTGPGATACGVVVSDAALGNATANDNCPGVVVTRTGVPAGNLFPVGPTIITYTATDRSGNTAQDTQTITVFDTTPPIVTPPGPVTLFTGPGATICGVTVSDLDGTLGTGTASDNCPGVGSVSRSGVPAGNVFPVGTTTLTYSATDAHGNSGSATQVVTVIDNTAPIISCPSDIIADYDPAVNGAVVTYTAPVGTDNCPGATTAQIAGLASGSTFPVGTTTNTFKVTDAHGNTAECSFKVTVAITSVIGLDSVSLTGNVLMDSYDSTIGYPASKGSLVNLLSNGPITISGSSKLFGNVRSTRVGVNVTGTAQVNGNATAGTTVTKGASAIITGTITNNALAPVMTLPSVVACGPPYSPNTGITGNYTYNPATGNLSVSGPNIATLANGTYCFNNVSLTNSSQLRVNGAVTLKLTGTFNAGGASTVNNTTQVPANLRILSSFSGSNGVIIGNGNSAYLLIYAPQTSVTNSGSAPLFGTIVGKTVTISNGGQLHYDTKLKTLWPELWTLILAP